MPRYFNWNSVVAFKFVAKQIAKEKKSGTVLDEISAFETNELTKLSRAARSPILQSMAKFNKLFAVSVGLFLVYIAMNALSTAS